MKRLILFSFLIICRIYAIDVNKPIQKVFKVYTYNNMKVYNATAFAISENKLLTAAHPFIHTAKEGKNMHYLVIDGKLQEINIIKIDYDLDICLLECPISFKEYYKLSDNSKDISKNQEVKSIGLVFNDAVPNTITGKITKLDKFVNVNFGIPNGFSGCPIINTDNLVVGMGVFGTKSWTRCISCETLNNFTK